MDLKEELIDIEGQFLGGQIPGELFYEAIRKGGLYDDGDACWETSFNLVEQFIQKQREYISYLEQKISDFRNIASKFEQVDELLKHFPGFEED